jgi:hypothetical protein
LITADVSEVTSTIEETEALLAEAPELPLEVVNRLVGFLDSHLEVAGVESVSALGQVNCVWS